MRRREFIAGLGSAAAATAAPPRPAHAQPGGTRRIGAIIGWSNAAPYDTYVAAFVARLAQLGWVLGRNLAIEQRWTEANVGRARVFANELVALQPS
jgi:putative tryptophan/tyrosine transport system substrate-binding protein